MRAFVFALVFILPAPALRAEVPEALGDDEISLEGAEPSPTLSDAKSIQQPPADMDDEKARLFVMLGALRFAEGNRDEAKIYFQKALALAPHVALSRSDAVDEQALPFFKNLGGTIAADEPKVIAALPDAVPPPDPVTEDTAASSVAAASVYHDVPKRLPTIDASGKVRLAARKTTRIKIETGVSDAMVFADGVLLGQAGVELEVDAGRLVFEVVAPGYTKQTLRFDAEKDKMTVRSIALRKAALAK